MFLHKLAHIADGAIIHAPLQPHLIILRGNFGHLHPIKPRIIADGKVRPFALAVLGDVDGQIHQPIIFQYHEILNQAAHLDFILLGNGGMNEVVKTTIQRRLVIHRAEKRRRFALWAKRTKPHKPPKWLPMLAIERHSNGCYIYDSRN